MNLRLPSYKRWDFGYNNRKYNNASNIDEIAQFIFTLYKFSYDLSKSFKPYIFYI